MKNLLVSENMIHRMIRCIAGQVCTCCIVLCAVTLLVVLEPHQQMVGKHSASNYELPYSRHGRCRNGRVLLFTSCLVEGNPSKVGLPIPNSCWKYRAVTGVHWHANKLYRAPRVLLVDFLCTVQACRSETSCACVRQGTALP